MTKNLEICMGFLNFSMILKSNKVKSFSDLLLNVGNSIAFLNYYYNITDEVINVFCVINYIDRKNMNYTCIQTTKEQHKLTKVRISNSTKPS